MNLDAEGSPAPAASSRSAPEAAETSTERRTSRLACAPGREPLLPAAAFRDLGRLTSSSSKKVSPWQEELGVC